MRAIAKLCLNSLWGKFGQRNNMKHAKFIKEVSEFYKIFLDDKLEVQNINFLNDDVTFGSFVWAEYL